MLFFFVATVLGRRQDRLTSVREEIDPFSFALEAWNTFFNEKYAIFFSCIRIIGKYNIQIGQKSIAILLLCLAVNGFGNF